MTDSPTRYVAALYNMNRITLADLVKGDGIVVATPTIYGGLEVDEVFLFDQDIAAAEQRALSYLKSLNSYRTYHDKQIFKPQLVCVQGKIIK